MGESTDADSAAFEALRPRLEKEHPHEVVLLQSGKLMGAGKDYDEAIDRALANPASDKRQTFFLRRVGPHDEDLICIF